MLAVNHFVVQSLNALGDNPGQTSLDKVVSDGNFFKSESKETYIHLILVMFKTVKEGISITEKDVENAVQEVMLFLYMGKSDSIGVFGENSKCGERKHGKVSSVGKTYSDKLETFLISRLSNTAAIVSISSFNDGELDNVNLKLTSRDFNCSDFSTQLADCLTRDSCMIHIECSELNRRGLKRLVGILNKMSTLFDNRVRIVLLSVKILPPELQEFTEKDFASSYLETPPKKARVEILERSKRHESELKEANAKVLDLFMENKELNAKNDKLNREILKYKQGLDVKLKESQQLSSDLEGIKAFAETVQAEKDTVTQNYTNLEANHQSVKIENTQLSLVSENLKAENDKMGTVQRTLELKLESLQKKSDLEKSFVGAEKEKLKVEVENLMVENNSMRYEMDVLKKEKESVNVENITLKNKDKSKMSDFDDFKECIKANQRKLINSSAPEIVRKSMPKLHFKSLFDKEENGNVTISVKILRAGVIQCYGDLLEFQGSGSNKKKAKINAFENFIENVLQFDPN